MEIANGYERVAEAFLRQRSGRIGVAETSAWAQALPEGAAVLDVGCGSGFPLTAVLVKRGLQVYAVEAAPTLAADFRRGFPNVPLLCESVEDSRFFRRSFDGILAWGLLFLLPAEQQCRLLRTFGDILLPGGQLLFTAPAEKGAWIDTLTGLESRSLGTKEYQQQLSAAGLSITREFEDSSQNYYFEACKLQRAGSET